VCGCAHAHAFLSFLTDVVVAVAAAVVAVVDRVEMVYSLIHFISNWCHFNIKYSLLDAHCLKTESPIFNNQELC
jgi:hypothetical protein